MPLSYNVHNYETLNIRQFVATIPVAEIVVQDEDLLEFPAAIRLTSNYKLRSGYKHVISVSGEFTAYQDNYSICGRQYNLDSGKSRWSVGGAVWFAELDIFRDADNYKDVLRQARGKPYIATLGDDLRVDGQPHPFKPSMVFMDEVELKFLIESLKIKGWKFGPGELITRIRYIGVLAEIRTIRHSLNPDIPVE